MMKTLMIFGIYLATYLPLLFFSAFTPYLTRRTESFGIGIPEERYDEPRVKKIRENYRNTLLLIGTIITVLSLILIIIYPMDSVFAYLMPVASFFQLGLMFGFYLKGHRKMKALKAAGNWEAGKEQVVMVDTDFRKKRMLVSVWWFSLYPVVIMATLAIGFVFYSQMPERVPIHYNLSGEATQWATKSYRLLLAAPLLQTIMMFLMVFIYWIIGKAKQQVDPANPEGSVEQNRIFRYRWSAFTVFAGLMTIGLFGIMQLSFTGLIKNIWLTTLVTLGLSLGITVGAIVLSFTTGQGGSRVSIGKSKSGTAINRNDDQYWKLGIFYYNPDDPALFVEKRFGIGWTNNFARSVSWVILLGFILVLPLLIWTVSSLLTK